MTQSTVIPCLRYRDAPAAINWLGDVLGFEAQLVVPGPGETIAHAQLRLRGGMVMVGSAVETEYGKFIRQPNEPGVGPTSGTYVLVDDADVVYERVQAREWRVLIEIKDEDYGGRGFTCADPEGHVWSVGTYDPWAG
jgi:uncharacterized glyoxalase superfamily protein PhnB